MFFFTAKDPVWESQHKNELVNRLYNQLPDVDEKEYTEGAKKVDWYSISFPPFTDEQCRDQWEIIHSDVNIFIEFLIY